MPHYKLRRCDICGKFHASFSVPDPKTGGKVYYCQTCWKARYGKQQGRASAQKEETPEERKRNESNPED